MVFGLFKKKVETDLHGRIASAFSKVDSDITQLNRWIEHINSKQQDLHSKHAVHVSLTQKELADLKQWVSFLHNHLASLHSQIRNNSEYVESLKKELVELNKRTLSLENVQKELGASQFTQRNQPITPQLRGVIAGDTQAISHISRNSSRVIESLRDFSSSEKQVIWALYGAERPKTYEQIAAQTDLNYGTVKNIIYKLRKKGFGVSDQVTPDGEKEFFLLQKEKIELSGR